MFRSEASFPLRFVRTVLFPSGPLILTVVLVNLTAVSESLGQVILLASGAWFFCSLILVPALLFRPDSLPGPSTDEGGGGERGPQEPPSPGPGAGEIPLPDADQSRIRLRDHVRPKRRWPRRRGTRKPDRTSTPSLPD